MGLNLLDKLEKGNRHHERTIKFAAGSTIKELAEEYKIIEATVCRSIATAVIREIYWKYGTGSEHTFVIKDMMKAIDDYPRSGNHCYDRDAFIKTNQELYRDIIQGLTEPYAGGKRFFKVLEREFAVNRCFHEHEFEDLINDYLSAGWDIVKIETPDLFINKYRVEMIRYRVFLMIDELCIGW